MSESDGDSTGKRGWKYRWPSRSLQRIRRFGRPAEGRVPDTRGNVRASLAVMLTAAATLAIFASHEFQLYTRDLPGNRVSDALVASADRWHAAMERLGPAHVRPALRALFDQARDAGFPGQERD